MVATLRQYLTSAWDHARASATRAVRSVTLPSRRGRSTPSTCRHVRSGSPTSSRRAAVPGHLDLTRAGNLFVQLGLSLQLLAFTTEHGVIVLRELSIGTRRPASEIRDNAGNRHRFPAGSLISTDGERAFDDGRWIALALASRPEFRRRNEVSSRSCC